MDQQHGDGMERNLGMSRRELIRRGALAGGVLIWSTPIIQSVRPAFAHNNSINPSQASYCCFCWNGDVAPDGGPVKNGNYNGGKCFTNGYTEAECIALCSDREHYEWHGSDQDFECNSNRSSSNPLGCHLNGSRTGL